MKLREVEKGKRKGRTADRKRVTNFFLFLQTSKLQNTHAEHAPPRRPHPGGMGPRGLAFPRLLRASVQAEASWEPSGPVCGSVQVCSAEGKESGFFLFFSCFFFSPGLRRLLSAARPPAHAQALGDALWRPGGEGGPGRGDEPRSTFLAGRRADRGARRVGRRRRRAGSGAVRVGVAVGDARRGAAGEGRRAGVRFGPGSCRWWRKWWKWRKWKERKRRRRWRRRR